MIKNFGSFFLDFSLLSTPLDIYSYKYLFLYIYTLRTQKIGDTSFQLFIKSSEESFCSSLDPRLDLEASSIVSYIDSVLGVSSGETREITCCTFSKSKDHIVLEVSAKPEFDSPAM